MTHTCPDCGNTLRDCCDSMIGDAHRTVCDNGPKLIKPPYGAWSCPNCTARNVHHDTKCRECGTPR